MNKKLLLSFVLFFTFLINYGQSASNYCFSASTGTYNALTGSTNANGMPTALGTDDAISNSISLPFTFTFGGIGYNQVKISSNGWLTFGGATDSQYDNTLANAESSKPILFPFWDDLRYNAVPRYVTSGTTPNRIFKVEWLQQYFYSGGTAGDAITFQVWLYEGSNKIDYRYRRGSVSPGVISASVGIYDSKSGYLTLNDAGANPTAQAGTFTTNINVRPATGQIYSFSPSATTSIGTYNFCIDSNNTQTTGNVNAGQYALVDVIKGYKYTFTVGNVFTAFSEKLNLLDASTDLDVVPAATNTGVTGTSIANWIAPFSGQIKVVLSTGSCANNGTIGTGGITLVLNAIGNTQDSQAVAGADTWRGHIYNWTGSTPPGGASPAAPAATTPFSTAEYAGYYDESTESITQNFGGDDVCFPVFSNGVQRASIRTEQFAVRYRMTTTKTGCYLVKVRADDGVRLYVDGVKVVDQWQEQSPTTYSNVLVNLTNGSNLILDYYENSGGNTIEFSMTPFLASTNTIIAPAVTTVCTGDVIAGPIDGSAYAYNGAGVNPTIKFQWQSAPDNAGVPGAWSNVTTGTGITAEDYTPAAITGNTTTNITYYRRNVSAVASNASSCSFDSNYVSIITKPSLVINTQPAALTICEGTNGSFTIGTPAGFTYQWQYSSSATGPWTNTDGRPNVTGHNTATLSLTSASVGYNGNYVRCIVSSGSCSTTSNVVLLTVYPLPTAPIVGAITVPTCAVPKGSVALSGLPGGGFSWEIETNPVTVKTTGIGTSTTITGLDPNTYTFTVKHLGSTCTSLASLSAVVPVLESNIWNGTAWSKVSVPTINENIVFAGNFNSTGNINGCSCQVNSGSAVVINSGHVLTITNGVAVSGGTLTFENNASLMQTNNVANSGNITYKRISTPMIAFDYSYWSSPVDGQLLRVLSPNTLPDKYHSYNNGWVEENGTNMMTLGKGYIIRVPNAGSWAINNENVVYPYAQPVSFFGVANNGPIIGETITKDNLYLIGNPYPSALDADKFLTANKDILNGTIYFWTHNTAIAQSGPYYVYTSDDYASYNGVGGTATVRAISGGATPSGQIAAGQSFFGIATGNGAINYTNAMRSGGNNSQFFKPSKTNKTTDTDEKSRLWLNLTNVGGVFKQTLIGYVAGATNGYDNLYDGLAMNRNSYVDFYSINKTDKLVIQGRALPFEQTDIVPLGYSSTKEGDFTIEIDKADGSLTNQAIYLEDKKTAVIHDLTQKGYTFNTGAGTFDDRFVLRYTNKTLGTGEFELGENAILVAVANKEVKINAFSLTIDKVFIYDVSGKLIYKKEKVGNSNLVIENLKSSNQVLLVKVVLDNKHTETKKVIY
ncbi:T9SS sorting signal type C domain-containing protein [Flavobacterium sp. LS1R49]|uniref:T9SS sorting signal type C domain-containing protein n=1 Tax=Flavobacterium shii TaxID=2987687 RepID=A0A9X2ZDD9_9FLAO|nr:T9SS sorting signal type C domain-containing protein [Flavobacterium shii]MCV9927697.1 T9SS sorting signal type C domain-containing protein [Flavobacterium shii]